MLLTVVGFDVNRDAKNKNKTNGENRTKFGQKATNMQQKQLVRKQCSVWIECIACSHAVAVVVCCAVGWLKRRNPGNDVLVMCCRAVELCPGLRLQEGVKRKAKRPRGDGPLANIRVGVQLGDGRQSSLAQGSMQNR